MTRTYEVIIHNLGNIILEETLEEDDVIEAIRIHGPVITLDDGTLMDPKKMMALAVLADGFWTHKDFGIMVKRSR